MNKKLMSVLMIVVVFSMISLVSAVNLYVDTGGDDLNGCELGSACLTIQRAFDIAVSGDIIKVNAGTYSEGLTINTSSVTIYSSGGAIATTINGSIDIQDNAGGFIMGGSNGKGFTIENNTLNVSAPIVLITLAGGANNIEFSHNVINTSNELVNGSNHSTFGIVIKTLAMENLTLFNNTFYLGNESDEAIASDETVLVSGLNITLNIFNAENAGFYAAALSITQLDVSTVNSYFRNNTVNDAKQGIAIGNVTDDYGFVGGAGYFEINENVFWSVNTSVDIISMNTSSNESFQNISILDNNFSVGYTGVAINGSIVDTTNTITGTIHQGNFSITGNIFENNVLGVNAINTTNTAVNAENNYWNHITGPGGALILDTGKGGSGGGDNVTTGVDFSPWCADNVTCAVTSNVKVSNDTFGINNFTSIKDAVGNASAGDIIEIGAGLFNEGNTTINEELTLIGVGVTTEIIADAGDSIFNITIRNVELRDLNLTIANPTKDFSDHDFTEERMAIHINANGVTINNTVIRTSGNRSHGIKVGAGNYTNVTHYVTSNEAGFDDITIVDNNITTIDISISILSVPTNTTDVHSGWNITRNIITSTRGKAMQLNDVNNSEISYNNFTSTNYSLGNVVIASVFNNISSILFLNNLLNYTFNDTSNAVLAMSEYSTNNLLDITIEYNTIQNFGNATGLWFNGGGSTGASIIAEHNIFENDDYTEGYGVQNNGSVAIDVSPNYWGNTTGPGGNGTNGGAMVNGLATYDPWYTAIALTTISEPPAAVTTTDDGSGSGGGGSVIVKWKNTYVVNDEDFIAGYSKELGEKGRIRVKVDGKTHHVGVTEITASTVTIEVASEHVTATLSIGDERKFDVTEDGFYDISVILNSIANNKAVVTVKSINEQITVALEEEQVAQEEEAVEQKEEDIAKEEESKYLWIWIVVIVLILIIVGGGFGVKHSRKKRK